MSGIKQTSREIKWRNMMVAIPESARQVITSGRLGHLVTLNADGSPQVTCVWTGLAGDEIITAHLGEWQKVKNVRRDPRVALSIETDTVNDIGLTEYLVVYGHAEVTEGGAPEQLQELAYTYIGPGVKFPPMDSPPPGFLLHITVDRFGGVGPWSTRTQA
jgi:PPOX class probable F420-dependent enzyme